MSAMNVLRKGLPAAALPVVVGLAAVGLAIAPAAQAVSAAPVRAASAGLHVTGKVDLGRLGSDFSYRGSTLRPVFSKRVSNSDTDIAGTGIGLLLLGAGKVSLLDPGNGHAGSVLSVPGAVILVPGPSAAVVTVSHSTTYLLRLAG